MDAEIRNAQGERLDYAFHAAKSHSPFTVVIGHGVTANMDRPFVSVLAASLAKAGIPALRFSFSGNGDSQGDFREATITKEVADLGVVLDALEGERKHIICSTHGALFKIEDGYCISGPCRSSSLEAVPVTIKNGAVLIL